ncbi:hypothetical protein GCM10023080_029750 [Streptomyces pseudoechinosporeus]
MSTRRKARRPQSRSGRPRLLSEEVEARLVAASRTGVAVELAAEVARVSRIQLPGVDGPRPHGN